MRSHWNRNPKNSGARKPRKQAQKTTRARAGRHGRGTTKGETPATQPHDRPTASNGNQQRARAGTTGAKARQNTTTQKQSKQHQRHADTRHKTRHRTHANPPTHSPRHQRQTPATTAPHPRSRTRKKEFQQCVWCTLSVGSIRRFHIVQETCPL